MMKCETLLVLLVPWSIGAAPVAGPVGADAMCVMRAGFSRPDYRLAAGNSARPAPADFVTGSLTGPLSPSRGADAPDAPSRIGSLVDCDVPAQRASPRSQGKGIGPCAAVRWRPDSQALTRARADTLPELAAPAEHATTLALRRSMGSLAFAQPTNSPLGTTVPAADATAVLLDTDEVEPTDGAPLHEAEPYTVILVGLVIAGFIAARRLA